MKVELSNFTNSDLCCESSTHNGQLLQQLSNQNKFIQSIMMDDILVSASSTLAQLDRIYFLVHELATDSVNGSQCSYHFQGLVSRSKSGKKNSNDSFRVKIINREYKFQSPQIIQQQLTLHVFNAFGERVVLGKVLHQGNEFNIIYGIDSFQLELQQQQIRSSLGLQQTQNIKVLMKDTQKSWIFNNVVGPKRRNLTLLKGDRDSLVEIIVPQAVEITLIPDKKKNRLIAKGLTSPGLYQCNMFSSDKLTEELCADDLFIEQDHDGVFVVSNHSKSNRLLSNREMEVSVLKKRNHQNLMIQFLEQLTTVVITLVVDSHEREKVIMTPMSYGFHKLPHFKI